ncbi:C-type lectin domain family 4 member F-like [Mytilus californianus]|uniref:C-type lectin domain family 4 member F-like n=1 Tax=Mytilus californianus TaxID=6549 RepID=UPI00224646BB|nr:C-type lectin domain family 4 member F-like [Mytilus californianus]
MRYPNPTCCMQHIDYCRGRTILFHFRSSCGQYNFCLCYFHLKSVHKDCFKEYIFFNFFYRIYNFRRRVKFDEIEMWLVVIFSFLSYTCNGSLVDHSTQSSVIAELKGTDITDIIMEVDVLKGNYHSLLLRVINNEHEIAFLKGQTQQLEHELETTRRTFSCELQGLLDTTIQYEHKLNETIHSLATFNQTIQDLSQSVSVLDNKYSLLEIPGRHSNESGDEQECPLDWIRRVDFGACYFFSNESMSWNDSQRQCRKHNGSLTDIYSENEAVWLAEYSRNHTATIFWIGGKTDHGVFKWFTSDGETKHMNYTRWGIGGSWSKSQTNRCAFLIEYLQYEWYAYDCDLNYHFICKTIENNI